MATQGGKPQPFSLIFWPFLSFSSTSRAVFPPRSHQHPAALLAPRTLHAVSLQRSVGRGASGEGLGDLVTLWWCRQ